MSTEVIRPSQTMRMLMLIGILAGFLLRLFRLGAESLWYDETVSVHLARLPLMEMIEHTARDIHPPGYYLLLHLWQRVTTPRLDHGLEFLFAWPSLVAGMLIMVLLFALGRRLFGARTAVLALWLAALHPFQLWYSQEVRMYSVGGALALLCLWAMLQVVEQHRPRLWLLGYTLGAAAGLYTLYYFAFWLAALNLIAFSLLWRNTSLRGRRIATWLAAQGVVLLLMAPWLPTAVRQIVEPPVPPWRAPWSTFAGLAESITETGGALFTGQSPPATLHWPWALIVVGVTISFIVWGWRNGDNQRRRATAIVLTALFLPIAALYVVTLLVTPIYHVRYISLYAPLFLLIPATQIDALLQTRRWAGLSVLVLWLAVELGAVYTFWQDARYRADDHRGAVTALAAGWRPGDAILANAGWIYPVLTTYWPTELEGSDGVVPPSIGQLLSIDDYAQTMQIQPSFSDPAILRTGSIDGAASLGWGNPASDFFAISTRDTVATLAQVAAHAQRLWHYRLYDTVSDPAGVIRTWLTEHATLLSDTAIPGRDFGALQLWATAQPPATPPESSPRACFGELLCVHDYAQNGEAAAGAYLYYTRAWSALRPLTDLTTSLRLYDQAGRLAAQLDAPLLPPSSTWTPGAAQVQSLALPIAASTKPGAYSLELVVYRPDTGEALSLSPGAPSDDGQRLRLGTIQVTPPPVAPTLPTPQAAFDYLDLLDAHLAPTIIQPGGAVQAALTWRPRPSAYRDTYQAVLSLRNAADEVVETAVFTLGGHEYPSGDWPPGLPVRDLYDLTTPATVAPGAYTLDLTLRRAGDGAPIPARRGWLPVAAVPVGVLQVEPP